MIKLATVFVALSLLTSTYGQMAYDEPYPVIRLPRAALFGLFGHHAPVAVPAPSHPVPSPHGGPYPQPGYPSYPGNPAYSHHGGTPTAVPAPTYPGGAAPYRPMPVYGQAPHYFLF